MEFDNLYLTYKQLKPFFELFEALGYVCEECRECHKLSCGNTVIDVVKLNDDLYEVYKP